MTAANPANERIKRRYFEYQKETLGLAASTIDHAAAAIFEYEQFTEFADFKKWSLKKALAYKKKVMAAASKRTGVVTSRATVVSKLRLTKNFFLWLATQPGYRSKITRAEVEYLAPTRHDVRLARAPSGRSAPTLEQARHVILSMPATTAIELRNRALLACALLTGARISALITLKLKHVRADRCGIEQDAREVHTKFSKSQTTFLFPVGDDIRQIFLDYVDYLTSVLLWNGDDPLFPATRQSTGSDHQFHVIGLKREHWLTPEPVRSIFRRAFAAAELTYFAPHTFRSCLMNLGERLCRNFREMKAFSRNLGHDEVRTSMTSYGPISSREQGELLQQLGAGQNTKWAQFQALLTDPHIQAVMATAAASQAKTSSDA